MDGRHLRMHPDTRQVLEHIARNPGVGGDALRAKFKRMRNLKKRLWQLVQSHNTYTVKTPGVRARAYFPTRGGLSTAEGRFEHMPTEVRVLPVGNCSLPSRTVEFRPWPEPYLPEWHIRRSGLDYRNCASVRGTRRVYCYRRDNVLTSNPRPEGANHHA